MKSLRVAVVGCGHLGSIHARLLKSLDDVELVGVVDPLPASRTRVAAECQTSGLSHHDALRGRIDAAVIATPTVYHHEVAEKLLGDGVHLLIEKPVTSSVAEANHLIALAQRNNLVLQVGHVERFNPAWNAVAAHLTRPQYIEAVRAGTYTFRSTDVSIVLDLMIHDLDLVLSLARSPVVDVDALGMAVFGPHEDLAWARLTFANGCVATLKASRLNYAPQRTMHIFSERAFAAIDFATGEAKLVRPSESVMRRQVNLVSTPPDARQAIQENMFQDLLRLESVEVNRTNAILEEQREFAAAILHKQPVRVSGEQGRDALEVAEHILASIRAHRWNSAELDAIGPHAIFPAPTAHAKRAA